MPLACDPVSFVLLSAILVVVGTFAMTLIVFPFAVIEAAVGQLQPTLAMALIVLPRPLIDSTAIHAALTVSRSHSTKPLTRIN